MRVQTEWRPGTSLFDIWIWQDVASGRQRLIFLGDGKLEWQVVEEGNKVEPSITLPGDVWSQLMAEATGTLPPSAAQAAHLADAIEVRDKLFEFFTGPRFRETS